MTTGCLKSRIYPVSKILRNLRWASKSFRFFCRATAEFKRACKPFLDPGTRRPNARRLDALVACRCMQLLCGEIGEAFLKNQGADKENGVEKACEKGI